jgi:hypothetical protein
VAELRSGKLSSMTDPSRQAGISAEAIDLDAITSTGPITSTDSAAVLYDDGSQSPQVQQLYRSYSLDASRSQIRVFVLRQATTNQLNEPLSGSFQIISLEDDSNIPYAALSYVWGKTVKDVPAADRRHLTCNSVRIDIGESCWDALAHLRKPDGDLVIWIDAICINQNDLAEKGTQVAMMGNIYKSASTTFVWLGPRQRKKRPWWHLLPPLDIARLEKHQPWSTAFLWFFSVGKSVFVPSMTRSGLIHERRFLLTRP